jgi:hypothetical protein
MKIYFKDCGCDASELQLNQTCLVHNIVQSPDADPYIKIAAEEDNGYWSHYLTPQHKADSTYGEYFTSAYNEFFMLNEENKLVKRATL